jgi:hypothetical protein
VTDREAQELIRMVESNWSFDLETARPMWRAQLLPFDAEIATQAIVRLARTQTSRPRLADVLEVIRVMTPAVPPARFAECETCNGNRFVVVYLRKPVTTKWMEEHGIQADEEAMIEEMAPCPDCNADANTAFRRPDGTETRTMDPARVRELLAQRGP